MIAALKIDHPGRGHRVNLGPAFIWRQAFSEWKKKEEKNHELLQTSAQQGGFLVSTDGIELLVWLNEWKSTFVFLLEKLQGYTFEINVLILWESLSMKATWSTSVIPSWEAKVQGQSVLAKDCVCQANSWAGTHGRMITPANGTGGHFASKPEMSKILALTSLFFFTASPLLPVNHLHFRQSFILIWSVDNWVHK